MKTPHDEPWMTALTVETSKAHEEIEAALREAYPSMDFDLSPNGSSWTIQVVPHQWATMLRCELLDVVGGNRKADIVKHLEDTLSKARIGRG